MNRVVPDGLAAIWHLLRRLHFALGRLDHDAVDRQNEARGLATICRRCYSKARRTMLIPTTCTSRLFDCRHPANAQTRSPPR
jgi:hypothetical protein